MTKSRDLGKDDVVRAALEVLDRVGAANVSMRAVAEHLGVRMNTVVWHVKTSAQLRELMADAIVAGVAMKGLPKEGSARARELLRRYRRALLAHRDGATLVTGTFVAASATLRFAEELLQALAGPRTEQDAAWTAWSLTYFVLGLVAEEQAATTVDATTLRTALAGGEYPVLERALEHFTGSFDSRFEHGLDLLLATPPKRRARS